jgi:hypothetical protein
MMFHLQGLETAHFDTNVPAELKPASQFITIIECLVSANILKLLFIVFIPVFLA